MSKQVDIQKVFTDKNPKLAKRLPGFVFAYLRRIAHEDYVNWFLDKHGHKEGIEFVHAAIEEFEIKLEVEGEEKLPKNGRYIFASNHPLGGFDGLLLMHVINRHYSDYKFLVNDILYNIPQLRPLFIPLNKHGKQNTDFARMLDETLKSDAQVLTFPAGLVSRRIKGQIIDLEWKKSFIQKAVQYQRDIVPVFITGNNTNFFYNFANFRKALGIKANIEMLYLVDETYKHRKKNIKVIFGKPISYNTFTKEKNYKEWAKWVKEQVYLLNGVKTIPL